MKTSRVFWVSSIVLLWTLVFAGVIRSEDDGGQAGAYRKAAQAYRDAAAKTSADKKDCYLKWAVYYDCLVKVLGGDGTVEKCDATVKPTCTPGQAE